MRVLGGSRTHDWQATNDYESDAIPTAPRRALQCCGNIVQNTKKNCTFRHLTCPFCVFYRVSICSVYQSRSCHHVLATKAMFELTIRERLTSYHVCKTGKYWVLLIVFSLLTLCIPPYEENRTDKRMKGNTWSSRNIRVLVCFVRNCLYKTAAQTKLRSVPDIWDYIAIQLLLVMFKI